ncbi:YqiA/YcfP family alpha/beta fold hydrolase [uncultured Prevotella sp.]|uniref:YqiA/YcfP family alpha/beta fold hydrolase n=1 Tax=uncultured Prevotella sp. TaxID=159272 RepID=UPI00265D207F|nr:YqiA/YcfP family alpha/beta fold hydrolase [uncultured Prevotella sp.]
MENNYAIQFPEIMKGKKILYVHGFSSSGQSGTVVKIREMLPGATVVAPDLPLHPAEAMDLLHHTCETENPDLIIGTSMGGMYAEMLYGYDRILVNPAFQMGDTMLKHGMLGKNTFLNPRQDGVQEFIVTKSLVEEYKEITARCFAGVTEEESRDRVYGLFGDEDPVVHTRDLFSQHYRNAISFHGEHRMNDKILLHSVLPVVQWIDDRQEHRERPIIYVSIDTLRDARGNQMSSAMKAFRYLFEHYAMYIVAPSPAYNPEYIAEVMRWAEDVVNVPAWQHLVFTNRKDLIYGDYLIDPSEEYGAADFMGTLIKFGSDTFKTWEEIIEFFSRLGGQ